MRHAIVSTIGTSLLTNNADRETGVLLRNTANLAEEEYDAAVIQKVRARVREVRGLLERASEADVRRLSAELNGILSLSATGSDCCHYLLCTDTFQGRQAADLVSEWLRQRGCEVVPQVLKGLSMASRADFARGVDFLLHWCDLTLPALRNQGWRITFNLVGGFKSLQAYAHTLGMFYADEITYIFEGEAAELIRIPRLPLAWETRSLEKHAAQIARLTQEGVLPHAELADLPEAYLVIDKAGSTTLSDWGLLAWNQSRADILARDLLDQPGLVVEDQFRKDWQQIQDSNVRVQLQEALAKIATLWKQDGERALRAEKGGLVFTPLAGHPGIDHFRVTDFWRVTCRVTSAGIRLRRFGAHDDVERNP